MTIRDGDGDRKGTPYLANRVYSHLRHFFTSCVRRKIITVSPMAEMPRPWNGEKPRDLHWFKGEAADDAVKKIWKAADEIGGVEGRFIKMLVLTGKRPGPGSGLADMRWENIAGAAWFWDAPPSPAKNKRRHAIHLPKLAQRVLHPRQQQGDVFPHIHFSKLQKRVKELTGMQDFIFHGIRHLVETKAAELKIAPHIRDLLLDHVPARGAGAGYDHHSYEGETREAIELWSSYVERLVDPTGGQVTVLR
jgi:integrase